MFEIVLLALIFSSFDHCFVAEDFYCPEFKLSSDLSSFSMVVKQVADECVSEVPEYHIFEQTFHIIDNFERACNYYYHGHLYWNRNRFIDKYSGARTNSSWYNQGYAIRKWDLDGPEEVATGISEGILRVDRLYRRKNMIQNESTIIYEDIITSIPKGGDFKVLLCSFIVHKSVKGNFEYYGEEAFNILWEPCTQRNSTIFYCSVPIPDKNRYVSIRPVVCKPGYEGFYCLLDSNSCERNFCNHSGQCFLGVEGDRCLCLPGFNGKKCEERVNPCIGVTCNNRGSCTVKNDHPVCVCNDENYTGAFCERRK
ncbi:Protocadherin Fat 4 [Trichinella patagoniensis]|uniref:Protocadherin Fat 4 n=1 Tax=Trichinella patagoniensis TaxID=990121 RepID=A0A0V1A3U5_9BILA|nr:Protocadherin Fat 4 [Trichinella patagoniensis]